MRKVKYIIASVFAVVLSLFALAPVGSVARAEASVTTGLTQKIESYTKWFVDAGNENSDAHSRASGTSGEKASAERICEMMEFIGAESVNNLSTKDGIQTFDVSTIDGLVQSQNVVFKKSCLAENPKKVVIATHYDNEGYYKADDAENLHYSEGVASSGAGVGLLLAIAEELHGMTFGFDIEYVFFGSHYGNLAGAQHYTSFISDEDAEDILLMINLDKVVSGGDLYLYTGEYPNESDEFVCSTIKNVVDDAKYAYDYRFLADNTIASVTGLDYTTVALESESAHFIRRNVKVLNILSVDDGNVGDLGIINYESAETAQTDTWSALQEKYGDALAQGLSDIADGVIALVSHQNFETAMSASPSRAYGIFGDKKMAVFVTAVLMIVFVFLAYLVHRKLSKRAEEAKRVCNFDAAMAEMASRTYESVEELVNEVTQKLDELGEKKDEAIRNKEEKGESEHESADTNNPKDDTKK